MAGAAGTVAGLTLLSRLTGLGRDMVFAALFGAGAATDAFNIAYTIPNVFRRLLGEGATSIAFVPVFAEWRANHPPEESERLYGVTFAWFSLVLLLVTATGVLLSPWIVRLFAPGFEPERYQLAVMLNRWVFPYLFLVGLVAVFAGMLHTHRHFAAPAASPILLNIGTVACAFGLFRVVDPPIMAMAIGVLVGGAGSVLMQWPALRARGIRFRPRLQRGHPGVSRMLRLMLPALFGVAVYQVNILVSRALASLLPRGNVTYLYYSDRFLELPLGVFAVSVATVALPSLASLAAEQKFERLTETLRGALRLTLLVCLPATAWLLVCRLPLMATLLERGRFLPTDSLATAEVFFFAVLGIPAIAVVRNLVPAFYSLQDARTPVWIAFFSFLLNAGLGLSLIGSLGARGLTLANTVSATAQCLLLIVYLRRKIGPLGFGVMAGWLGRLLAASLAAGACCWPIASLAVWTEGKLWARIGWLAAAGVLGVGVFIVVCKLLRIAEINTLLRRLWRHSQPTGTPSPPYS